MCTSQSNTSSNYHSSSKITMFQSFFKTLLYSLALLIALSVLTPVQGQTTEKGNTTEQETIVFLNVNQTSEKPQSINPRECYRRMDYSEQGAFICGGNAELLPLFLYAERVGREICETTFKNEIWNCSGFSLLKEPQVTKGDVYKESTYVYALSMAVITHTVAKACQQNILTGCSGSTDPLDIDREDGVNYEYSSDNVNYGLKIAKEFLKYRFVASGASLKSDLVSHNFLAIEKVIRNSISEAEVACSCIGASGSCTIQICNSELPNIEDISVKVKEMYDNSCRVKTNGHTYHSWIAECEQGYTDVDLIYNTENNWCRVDKKTGSLGLKGRVCNDDDKTCQDFCRQCGLSSKKETFTKLVEGSCKFVFCCRIECTQYNQEESYHVCT